MKFVVIIAIILLSSFVVYDSFAQEPRPQQEGVYYQKQSDGKYHEVWNFPDYRCQPDCKLTIALDKQPRSELGEENPHYQLGETVSMRIILFDIEYFGSDSMKSLDLNIWGNTHVKETMEIKPEEPLIFEYKIGDDFNIGEYKIFGIAGGMNQELFFTVYDPSAPDENLEQTSAILCGEGTILKDGFCVPERATMVTEMQKSPNGGGCLIATATYGSELAPQVQMLREIRDNSLLQTQSGQSFMQGFNQFYYSFSPIIADYERENPAFKEAVKLTIMPLITSLSLLNYVDIDSEAEVLGYGISLILLNVGMYFVLPVIVIHRIRKFWKFYK